MYDVFDISDYIINRESNLGRGVSNLKIHKLLYYVQGFHYVIRNELLFNDDFEAWTVGPIIPIVYDRYKVYGYSDIEYCDRELNISVNSRKVIDEVCDIFGVYSSSALENLICSEDTWLEARGSLGVYESCNQLINIDSMFKYFENEYILSSR